MSEEQDRGKRKIVNRTVGFMPGDIALLEWAAKFMGTSQSDIVRTSLRSYVIQLQKLEGK